MIGTHTPDADKTKMAAVADENGDSHEIVPLKKVKLLHFKEYISNIFWVIIDIIYLVNYNVHTHCITKHLLLNYQFLCGHRLIGHF